MIYYTNIGIISPDNNYLSLVTSDGTLVVTFSSFVSSPRNGDVFHSADSPGGSQARWN